MGGMRLSTRGGVGRKRAVVRDDGRLFGSVGAAALSAYGRCGGESNLRSAILRGGSAGGHRWRYADGEGGR